MCVCVCSIMASFNTLESFREYCLSRSREVRTLLFSADFSESLISVLEEIGRGDCVQSDVDAIVHALRYRHCHVACWFLVSSETTDWCIGYVFGDSSVAISLVSKFAACLFPQGEFRVYKSLLSLERDIWTHLFPHYTVLMSMGGVSRSSAFKTCLIVLENLSNPQFSILNDEKIELSQFCAVGRSCFVAQFDQMSVSVRLLNPDGRPCFHCHRGVPADAERRTIYAFMKPELGKFIESNFPGKAFKLQPDINNCGEFQPNSTRRSTEEVLSPPTLEKYNKGESKRTRNVPPSPQSLFSN